MGLREGLQSLSLRLAFLVCVLDDHSLLLSLHHLLLPSSLTPCASYPHLRSPPLCGAEEISLSSPWPLTVEANVGAPQVNYRESISRVSEVKYVHKKQSGGQGQFADITVRFEPMEPGSGYEFKSEIKGGAVPREYIPGVMKGLEECMSNGVLAGFPVVDVRAALVDGSYHDVDSSVLAFQLAARGAFREGMRKAGPKMLEPIMKVEVVTPEEHLGDVIGDLNSRRGQINSFGDKPGGLKVVDALVPLAEMFQYVSTLRGMTKGRASYTMQLAKFDVVPQYIQDQLAAKEQQVAA